MRYVALLRGINVNGQKMVKMDLLKSIFEEMKFENIKTYIQTGNVIFDSQEGQKDSLCNKIKDKLKETLGFEVPVILKEIEELEAVICDNPFKNRTLLENEKLHVTFLEREPSSEVADILKDYKEDKDEIILQGENVYILCRNGYGKTKFSNSFLESKLKVNGTTRNFNTINKIVELGRNNK